jgi:hypothetical protein
VHCISKDSVHQQATVHFISKDSVEQQENVQKWIASCSTGSSATVIAFPGICSTAVNYATVHSVSKYPVQQQETIQQCIVFPSILFNSRKLYSSA